MDDASQMAFDAMGYVQLIVPLLLIIGGVAFADLTIGFLIKLWKQSGKKLKW